MSEGLELPTGPGVWRRNDSWWFYRRIMGTGIYMCCRLNDDGTFGSDMVIADLPRGNWFPAVPAQPAAAPAIDVEAAAKEITDYHNRSELGADWDSRLVAEVLCKHFKPAAALIDPTKGMAKYFGHVVLQEAYGRLESFVVKTSEDAARLTYGNCYDYGEVVTRDTCQPAAAEGAETVKGKRAVIHCQEGNGYWIGDVESGAELYRDGVWRTDCDYGTDIWPTREAALAFIAEHADTRQPVKSRSVLKREAIQRGEEMPTQFDDTRQPAATELRISPRRQGHVGCLGNDGGRGPHDFGELDNNGRTICRYCRLPVESFPPDPAAKAASNSVDFAPQQGASKADVEDGLRRLLKSTDNELHRKNLRISELESGLAEKRLITQLNRELSESHAELKRLRGEG